MSNPTVTIPTPKAPKLLQLGQWILDPVGYMKNNFQQYGDLFQSHVTWSSSKSLLMLSDPKAMQYMLTHDTDKEFSTPGDVNEILAPLIGWQNIVLSSGNEHRRRRKLIMPPFHGERLKAYGEIIQNITQEVIAQWSPQEPFQVRSSMQKITMRVILEAVFGLHAGERYQKLERLLSQRLDMVGTPISSMVVFLPWLRKDLGSWSPGGQIRQLSEEIDRLLFAEIEERRNNFDPNRIDILSLLLMAEDEEGNGLTDQDLRDELMTLLLAGHETTATALTWAMYWLHSLPEVKEKLLAELETVNDPEDPWQLLKLPYLSAVCNETLRINPVAMLTFPRQVEEPMELCGYRLEPGMLLMGCIYLLHRREDLYPEPEQFQPERFLEREFSPYEFMPFGGGVRRCVGAALADYEMKIVLGTIMNQLDLALVNQRPVKPGRRGITLGQREPVWMKKMGIRFPSKTVTKV